MSAPTETEIREVDAGINDRLVDAAFEPRDPDEYVRGMQDDRDRCAYRGDYERAESLDAQVRDMRHPELDDREMGS